eukprot:GHVP01014978.1.p1 GENE.GHVP01014978.1~~GHVP01014978.1.p1  ORF type:complete len:816 (+),score=208.23 GHVP01014978.1:62-2509(+)
MQFPQPGYDPTFPEADPNYNPSTLGGGRVHLNPIEMQHYGEMFTLLDETQIGGISSDKGATFYASSGLPHEVLHMIWSLADSSSSGFLSFEDFAIGCRLVAHAQNGQIVSPEIISQEPPTLPLFDWSYMQNPTPAIPGAPLGYGGDQMALGAALDPMAAMAAGWNGDYASTATTHMMSPSQLETENPNSETAWQISEDMRQKYVQAFLENDSNSDGFVEGTEAQAFFSRSGLPTVDLSEIWTLSDRDMDGKLSINEFIVAMHLVSKRVSGFPLPHVLPTALQNEFDNHTNRSLPKVDAKDTLDDWGKTENSIFGSKSQFPTPDLSSDLFGEQESEKKETDSKSKKKSKKKKKEKDENQDDDGGVTFGDMVRDEKIKEGTRESVDDDWNITKSNIDTGFTKNWRTKEKTFDEYPDFPDGVIDKAIDADREIRRAVIKDVSRESRMMNDLTLISEAQRQELAREQNELRDQLQRKSDFEEQVRVMREELESIKEERRKIEMERIATERDISHHQDKIIFIKQEIEDVKSDIESFRESYENTNALYRDSEKQAQGAHTGRKNVQRSVKQQQQLLQDEEVELNELRNTLERLKREKRNFQTKTVVAQELSRQQRWMQDSAVPSSQQGDILYPMTPVNRYSDRTQSHTWSAEVGKTQSLVKDRKGVPIIPISQGNVKSMRTFSEAQHPVSYSTQPPSFRNKSEALEGRIDTAPPSHWKKFESAGAARGNLRRSNEERGIDRVLGRSYKADEEDVKESRQPSSLGVLVNFPLAGRSFEKSKDVQKEEKPKKSKKKSKEPPSFGDDASIVDSWPNFTAETSD